MKNSIKYFYDIETENIRQNGNRYFIEANSKIYALEGCSNYIDDINSIYELNKFMIYNNINVYPIIINNLKEIVTFINNEPYILILLNNNYNDKISMDDVCNYTFKIYDVLNFLDVIGGDKLKANNWKELWMNKIDYFEYQINQLGLKYPLIRESMGYFIGMAENAVSLLNNAVNDNLYLQHRRIRKNSTMYDFYNPLNIVFDTRIRDLAEYYKSCFIENEKIDICYYIQSGNYTTKELMLFYIRMLFPTFYFDKYEYIISERENEQKIVRIVDKISNYEILLKELHDYLGIYIALPNIDWLKK